MFNPSEASSNNNGTENVDEETDVTSTADVVPEYNAAGDDVTVIGVNNECLVSLANDSNNAAENLSTVPSIEFTVHEDSTHISASVQSSGRTSVLLDVPRVQGDALPTTSIPGGSRSIPAASPIRASTPAA